MERILTLLRTCRKSKICNACLALEPWVLHWHAAIIASYIEWIGIHTISEATGIAIPSNSRHARLQKRHEQARCTTKSAIVQLHICYGGNKMTRKRLAQTVESNFETSSQHQEKMPAGAGKVLYTSYWNNEMIPHQWGYGFPQNSRWRLQMLSIFVGLGNILRVFFGCCLGGWVGGFLQSVRINKPSKL